MSYKLFTKPDLTSTWFWIVVLSTVVFSIQGLDSVFYFPLLLGSPSLLGSCLVFCQQPTALLSMCMSIIQLNSAAFSCPCVCQGCSLSLWREWGPGVGGCDSAHVSVLPPRGTHFSSDSCYNCLKDKGKPFHCQQENGICVLCGNPTF